MVFAGLTAAERARRLIPAPPVVCLRSVGSLARNALTVHGEEAGRRGIHAGTTLTTALAKDDPILAGILVSNLVDNALRHNLAGGRAIIAVSNTGPVSAPGGVDRLSQPFQRMGSERIRHSGGHGPGLAIAAAIAKAHEATLTAAARAEGGFDIEVSFPRGE